MHNKNVYKDFLTSYAFYAFYTFCACIKRLSESSYLGFLLFVLFVRIKNIFSFKKNKKMNFSIKQTKKAVLNALKKKKHLRGKTCLLMYASE